MTVQRLLLFTIASGVFVTTAGRAQEPTKHIIFGVPEDTPVLSSSGDDIGIFTGRAVGVMTDASDCSDEHSGGNPPIQSVIFIHPHGGGGSTFATAILIETTDGPITGALRPGTRMVAFDTLGGCWVGGTWYNKFRATLQ
jgi:hypothetical protein